MLSLSNYTFHFPHTTHTHVSESRNLRHVATHTQLPSPWSCVIHALKWECFLFPADNRDRTELGCKMHYSAHVSSVNSHPARSFCRLCFTSWQHFSTVSFVNLLLLKWHQTAVFRSLPSRYGVLSLLLKRSRTELSDMLSKQGGVAPPECGGSVWLEECFPHPCPTVSIFPLCCCHVTNYSHEPDAAPSPPGRHQIRPMIT